MVLVVEERKSKQVEVTERSAGTAQRVAAWLFVVNVRAALSLLAGQ